MSVFDLPEEPYEVPENSLYSRWVPPERDYRRIKGVRPWLIEHISKMKALKGKAKGVAVVKINGEYIVYPTIIALAMKKGEIIMVADNVRELERKFRLRYGMPIRATRLP